MASRDDVVGILNLLKGCLFSDNYSFKDNRDKNIQALIDMEITSKQRKEILFSLVPEDYMSGPKPDDTDQSKEVWEFGKYKDGKDIYIKFRIAQVKKQPDSYYAVIWSFHNAEYPLKYSLRGGNL